MRRIIAVIVAVLALVSSAQAARQSQLSPQARTYATSGAAVTEVHVADGAYGYPDSPYYRPYPRPVYRYYDSYGRPYVMPPQRQPAPPPGTQRYDYRGKGVRCDNAVQGCYRWSGRQGAYIWDTNKTQEFYGPPAAKRGYPPRQQ